MNKKQAQNRMDLADLLDEKKPKQFDMSFWGRKRPHCGTTCCALGWACSLPVAKEAGIKLAIGYKFFSGEQDLEV